jgi:hypothetical protein
MRAAEKHEARSEKLAALVAEARELIEQARVAEVERARLAAEAAAAAVKAAEEAEAAAELQQLDEEMAALDTRRQQVQAKLGSSSVAPLPHLRPTWTRRRRCAWCAWTHLGTTLCCRACTCAHVGRAPSCSATAAQCAAGPSSSSRRCSPKSAQA